MPEKRQLCHPAKSRKRAASFANTFQRYGGGMGFRSQGQPNVSVQRSAELGNVFLLLQFGLPFRSQIRDDPFP